MTPAFFCSELNPRQQEPSHKRLMREVYQMKHEVMHTQPSITIHSKMKRRLVDDGSRTNLDHYCK